MRKKTLNRFFRRHAGKNPWEYNPLQRKRFQGKPNPPGGAGSAGKKKNCICERAEHVFPRKDFRSGH